jgi:hypothetical protein
MLRKRIDNLSAEVDKWSLRSGQLVVVDEASLAGTFALDTLTEQARNAGAKVVLVGDWASEGSPTPGKRPHPSTFGWVTQMPWMRTRSTTRSWAENAIRCSTFFMTRGGTILPRAAVP